MAQAWRLTEHVWLMQRGHLFPWAPVLMACGIGFYFSLRVEPPLFVLWACGALALMLGFLARRGREWTGPLLWAAALVVAGLAIAGFRAHQVAGPVLGWRYYGPIEGRVVGIDRSAADAMRLTLDRVRLRHVAPERIPHRIRVSLHGKQAHFLPRPGERVMLTGHLAPPGGPVEPGGFDFQRHAWFQGIGAIGYTRTPVLGIAPPEGGQWLFRTRMALSAHVQSSLPGQGGAFAAAVMTGDRSGLDQTTLEVMRISNIAHLLAISGLHMGLLAGFVFAVTRLGLALVPGLGLRLPVKSIAAATAIVAGAAYMALSGGNVATVRAFIMVSVMFVALMLHRRALSLRAVGVAGLIVLCLQPESLLGPGFQMSFAATVALVAVFGLIRDGEIALGPRWLRPVVAVVISSAVAGAATAPVAAAHFNQYAQYGLLANLLSVPLMGLLVMPAAVLSVLLLPFGLDWIALWAMQLGLNWILGVAHWVTGLEGARVTVVAPGPVVLPLLSIGALFLMLWNGRLRLMGVLPMIAAAILWMGTQRPDVLIAENGTLVGVMTEAGRALNKKAGPRNFVATSWLENDGDAALPTEANARWADADLKRLGVRLEVDRLAPDMSHGCAGALVLISRTDPERAPVDPACRVISPGFLRENGSVALSIGPGGLRLVTAREISGSRLWNGSLADRDAPKRPEEGEVLSLNVDQ